MKKTAEPSQKARLAVFFCIFVTRNAAFVWRFGSSQTLNKKIIPKRLHPRMNRGIVRVNYGLPHPEPIEQSHLFAHATAQASPTMTHEVIQMMDDEIHGLLRKEYKCAVIKVGSETTAILINRKRKIGLKKRVAGMLPLYEYEKWEEELDRWEYRPVGFRTIFSKKFIHATIAICYDKTEKTVYWRYLRPAEKKQMPFSQVQ